MKAIEGLFLGRVMRLVKLRHVLSARAHGFLVYLHCPRPTNSCHFNLVFTGVRMSDVYSPPSRVQNGSNCSSMEEYQRKWKQSIDDPAGFWGEIAERFHWKVPPSKEQFLSYNFNVNDGPIKIEWMKGAKLNICYNTLDRHLEKRAEQIAFFWEGNDPKDAGKITYAELHKDVCKFANCLKSKGVAKGDRVAIYMPMITELVVAMLACARIGTN